MTIATRTRRWFAALTLRLIHRLADPDAERTYTEGAMQTDVSALVLESFWRGLTSAREVVEAPTYDVEREINVIVVTLNVRVAIVP